MFGANKGPNFELSSKAAGHDLKGAIQYFSAQMEAIQNQAATAIRVPMQGNVMNSMDKTSDSKFVWI